MIGKMTGVCWGAPIDNDDKNMARALDCLESGHGRTLEFPDVYMIIDGYSARVMREWYTHIGGAPTRLQASTRYIDYANKGMPYIIPPKIANNNLALEDYQYVMNTIENYAEGLEEQFDIPREDVANMFPLGMESKMVCKINLRTLIDMSHQRMCARAYWEFRQLFNDLCKALKSYSSQWEMIVNRCFKPKCKVCGFCTEKNTCHMMPTKEELIEAIKFFYEAYEIVIPGKAKPITKFLEALEH